LYFSPEQVKNRHFRGPDVLIALGVEAAERKSWVVWHEGKAPDVVIELLSESTCKTDKAIKPRVYRDEVGVREYYWVDPFNLDDFAGFAFSPHAPDSHRIGNTDPMDDTDDGQIILPNLRPDGEGRIVSQVLGLVLGPWTGCYGGVNANWLRWYTLNGELLLTEEAERANEEVRRANEEVRRAEEEVRRANENVRRAEENARRAEESIRRAEEKARQEAHRADEEAHRADEEAHRADEEARRADRMAEKLRELGLDPNQIP